MHIFNQNLLTLYVSFYKNIYIYIIYMYIRRLQCLHLRVRSDGRGEELHDDGKGGRGQRGHHTQALQGTRLKHYSFIKEFILRYIPDIL